MFHVPGPYFRPARVSSLILGVLDRIVRLGLPGF
jgi:hypothetical protein